MPFQFDFEMTAFDTLDRNLSMELALDIQRTLHEWPCKVLSGLSLFMVNIVLNCLIYNLVWNVMNGGDKYQTLIYILSCHTCVYLIVANLVCLTLKNLIFWVQDVPPFLCLFQEFAHHFLLINGALTSMESNILSYLYLFRWKNLGILQDDFVHVLLLVINNSLSAWLSLLYLFTGALNEPYFYICSGQPIQPIQRIIPNISHFIHFAVGFVHVAVWIRVVIHRKKIELAEIKANRNVAHRQGATVISKAMRSVTAALIIVGAFIASALPAIVFIGNPQAIPLHPKAFTVSVTMPHALISLIIPVMSYKRYKEMSRRLIRHFEGRCSECRI